MRKYCGRTPKERTPPPRLLGGSGSYLNALACCGQCHKQIWEPIVVSWRKQVSPTPFICPGPDWKWFGRGKDTFRPGPGSWQFPEDFLKETSMRQWQARQGERRHWVSSYYSGKWSLKYCPGCIGFLGGPIKRSHNRILLLLEWTGIIFAWGSRIYIYDLGMKLLSLKKRKKIILANQLDHSSCARGRIWQLFLSSCGPNQLKKKSHLGASLKEIFSL